MQLPSTDRKELRLEVLKEAAQLGVNLYEEHKRFVMSIDPQWRADENVMLLLSAIALFTPERSNVVHKDVIKFEQVRDTYSVIYAIVYAKFPPEHEYLYCISYLQLWLRCFRA